MDIPSCPRWPRALLAALVLACGIPAADAVAQVSVDQVEVFLAPAPAPRKTSVINVQNVSDRPFQATMYLNDWDRDSTGNIRFFPVGQLRESCRDAIQVFPSILRLEPRSTQTVRVSFVGPDSLRSTCWSVLFVEMSDLQPARGRVVQYVVRAGVKVFVEPDGLLRDGAVEDMQVVRHVATREEVEARQQSAGDTTRRDFAIRFRNTGGMQIRPAGKLEIRKDDNTVVTTVPIDEFPVLPGAVRTVNVPLPPTLAPGKYTAIALIDFGGSEVVGGQVEFERR